MSGGGGAGGGVSASAAAASASATSAGASATSAAAAAAAAAAAVAAAGGNKRARGAAVVIPVVHGSIATWLGKKSSETRTHKWTVYFRGLNNQDISYFIKHVEFVLHESFSPQRRIVTSPPYEVSEYGWGEFEINMRVYFKDATEKPVDHYHLLRLFPPLGQEMSKKPVVSEHYDEIVFQDPPEQLLKILKAGPSSKFRSSSLAPHFQSFDGHEGADLQRIKDARKLLLAEKLKLEEKYKALDKRREELIREVIANGGRT